ncbi:MAG: MaoC/PaaZ C-terminal domain-containing protein [Myxococcota bacterium]
MAGSNREFIGRTQPVREYVLNPEIVAAYVDATGDNNARYAGEGAVAPPVSVVIGTIPHSIYPLLDQEEFIRDRKRFLKLLHGEEDIRWFHPIKPTDTFRMTTTVADLVDKSIGELMSLETEVRNGDEIHLATVNTQLIIRESKPAEERIKSTRSLKTDPTSTAEEAGEPIVSSWTVEPDQSIRYAKASGDDNPIHLDDETAKRAGLKGKILHGLCTMAFAGRTIVDRVLDGDPTHLKRLKVRFSKPVFMGDTLTCTLQPVAIGGHYRVSVQNQDGIVVLRDGVAEVDPSP